MNSIIAPTITVETEAEYSASIEKLKTFADHIHIDISDGEFAPVFLYDASKIWWPREWTVDVHAMVSNPNDYVDTLIALNPRLITFHAETGVDLVPIMQKIKQFGIKAGVCLLKTTVPETVATFIRNADHVLIFSGDLGHYGGVASLMQLEKIRLVKKINPSVEIGWDGGVNVENAYTLAQGGVNVLNVGGAINKSENPEASYEALVREIKKQGVI